MLEEYGLAVELRELKTLSSEPDAAPSQGEDADGAEQDLPDMLR